MSKPQKTLSPATKSFAPGQYIFHEGDPSKCMYLIQKGTISIRKYKGHSYVEIARLYSNEVIGELSFFDRLPRSASAVAMTDVELIELQFDALDKIFSGIPEYMKTIISAVADRLRKANDTIRRLQKNLVTDDAKSFSASKEDIPSDIPATDLPEEEGEEEIAEEGEEEGEKKGQE